MGPTAAKPPALTDLLLPALLVAETVLIAVGTGIACRVAFLADHPPTGWVLLTVSFGIAFVRALLFLYSYIGPPGAAGDFTYAGQVLGFPIVFFIFIGVLYLYRDFKRQLRDRQKTILT